MNRYNLIMILTVCCFFSCRKDFDATEIIDGDPVVTEYFEINVDGIVKDENGDAVSGVKLSIDGQEKISDNNGVYQFKNVVVGDQGFIIKSETEGYFNTMEYILSKESSTYYQNVDLVERANNYTFEARNGLVVYLKNGGIVSIPENALMYNNTDYSGSVGFSANFISSETKQTIAQMPACSLGEDFSKEKISIQSLGALVIQVFGDNGEELSLKPDQKITIQLPVTSSVGILSLDIAALYRLDDQSGKWIEAGQVSKESGFYTSEIESFGWWKMGYHQQATELCIDLKFDNQANANNQNIQLSEKLIFANGITNENGQYCSYVPLGTSVDLSVASLCQNEIINQNLGTLTEEKETRERFISTDEMKSMKGSLVNCDGASVDCGYVLLMLNDQSKVSHVTDGDYNFNFSTCDFENNLLETIAVDNGSQTYATQEYDLSNGSEFNININSCDALISYFTIIDQENEEIIIPGCIARQTNAELLITAGESTTIANAILGIQGSGDGEFKANFFGDAFSSSVEGDTDVSISSYQDIGGYIYGSYKNGGIKGNFVAQRIR